MTEAEEHAFLGQQAGLTDDAFWEALSQRLEAEQVIHAIQTLPDSYRWALYYHFVMDFTIPQTAAVTNQKISTAKMQLVRGKKLLLETLAVTGGDDQ